MLTVREAAARLNIRPITCRVWLIRGKIKGAFRHGRAWVIPPESLAGLKRHPTMGRPRKIL